MQLFKEWKEQKHHNKYKLVPFHVDMSSRDHEIMSLFCQGKQ